MLIAFEGIEGAGKSYAARRVADVFGVFHYSDPLKGRSEGRTPRDWAVGGSQANADVALFSKEIDVVVDRWALTAIVLDVERGTTADPEVLDDLAVGTDAVVFVLDVDPAKALSRAKFREERGLNLDLANARAEAYLDAAERWNAMGGTAIVVKDAEEAVHRLRRNMTTKSSTSTDFRRVLHRQRAFNRRFLSSRGISLDNMSSELRETLTKDFVLHTTDELHELLREVRWKMHRKPAGRPVDRGRVLAEYVDVFKFVLGIANLWGFTKHEIFQEFFRKSRVVEERFEDERMEQISPVR